MPKTLSLGDWKDIVEAMKQADADKDTAREHGEAVETQDEIGMTVDASTWDTPTVLTGTSKRPKKTAAKAKAVGAGPGAATQSQRIGRGSSSAMGTASGSASAAPVFHMTQGSPSPSTPALRTSSVPPPSVEKPAVLQRRKCIMSKELVQDSLFCEKGGAFGRTSEPVDALVL